MNVGDFVLERLGADSRQWRALTRSINKDSEGSRQASARRQLGGPGGGLLPYGVIGVLLCGLAFQLPTVSDSAAVVLSVFMLMVFVGLLTEWGRSLARDPLAPLRAFPVSERTFFVYDLTQRLRRTASVAALVAVPTMLLTVIREGAVSAIGWAMAAVLSSIFVAFLLAALLHWSRACSRSRPWAGSSCLFVGAALSGATLAGPLLSTDASTDAVASTAALPPLWFSAFVDVANGRRGAGILLFGGIALAGTLLAYVVMHRAWVHARGECSWTAHTPRQFGAESLAGRVRRRLPPEARVCATLLCAHLRRDADFRLRIVAALPLGFVLLSLSVLDFLQVEGVAERLDDFMSVGLVHIAAVAVPLSWLDAVLRSDGFRAAWVFAATPADIGKVAFWAGNVVGLLALPYMVLVGAVLFLVLGGGWKAIGHAVNLVLMANVLINAAVAIAPRVPFAAPPARPADASSRNFGGNVAGWSLAFLLLPALLSAATSRLWSAVCLALALIAAVAPLKQTVVRRGGRLS